MSATPATSPATPSRPGGLRLRSSDFRRERESQWRDLEEILEDAEKRGVEKLDAAELRRLPSLYRAAASSLSVARSISVDRGVLIYLESLVARGYVVVYGLRPRSGHPVRRFFARELPRTVRRHIGPFALALALLFGGVVAGLALYSPETYEAFVPTAMAQGRTPSSATSALKEVLDSSDGPEMGLQAFATALFTNNAKVGMTAAALGFALGLPTALLLLFNGLVLGAMAGLYASRGLGLDFWLWVLPHGVTELLAVALCGGAGLILARALIAPGVYGRRHALAHDGREAALIVLGAGLLFLVAGVIEGIFRQLVTDNMARGALSFATLVFWLVYFGWVGRDDASQGAGRPLNDPGESRREGDHA